MKFSDFAKGLVGGGTVAVAYRATEQTRYKNHKDARLETAHHYRSLRKHEITPFLYTQLRTSSGASPELVLIELDDWAKNDTSNKELSNKFVNAHKNYCVKQTRIKDKNETFIEFIEKTKTPPFCSLSLGMTIKKRNSMSALITDLEVETARKNFATLLNNEEQTYSQMQQLPPSSIKENYNEKLGGNLESVVFLLFACFLSFVVKIIFPKNKKH